MQPLVLHMFLVAGRCDGSAIAAAGSQTLSLFHFHGPMKMEQTECSEKSAYNIQMPGNYSEESIQHSEQGESLKSKIGHNTLYRGKWSN